MRVVFISKVTIAVLSYDKVTSITLANNIYTIIANGDTYTVDARHFRIAIV